MYKYPTTFPPFGIMKKKGFNSNTVKYTIKTDIK